MPLAEHFSAERLQRCAPIQIEMMNAAKKNGGAFNFMVKMTEEPDGSTTLDQIWGQPAAIAFRGQRGIVRV